MPLNNSSEGDFVSVEADRSIASTGPLAAFGRRDTLSFQADLDVLHTVSQGNSAKLWKTIATSLAGPTTGAPPIVTLPESAASGRDDPQQRRFPAARAPGRATISLSLRAN